MYVPCLFVLETKGFTLSIFFIFISAGVAGVVCLLLSIRLAHASLEHKLKARRLSHKTAEIKNHVGGITKAVYPCNLSNLII